MSSVSKKRRQSRSKRKISIRKRLFGTTERPRICVFRSHKNIYAQVVNDDQGATLLASHAGTAPAVEAPEGVSGKCALAYNVGRAIADQAKEKGISTMVFDRSGYLYHGRIAALARGLRDGGIEV
jgi:large subunit ribosomal protein L18|nr:50S ribosomal protein L18 [Candidatus Krumholzibacteria bacterium]